MMIFSTKIALLKAVDCLIENLEVNKHEIIINPVPNEALSHPDGGRR